MTFMYKGCARPVVMVGSSCGKRWRGLESTIVTQMDRVDRDTAFEMAVAAVRFGAGVTSESAWSSSTVGFVARHRGPIPSWPRLPPAQAVVDALDANGVKWVMYDRVHVEPTEQSWLDAIEFARAHTFDAIVGVGGGSSIDTAKAVNLYHDSIRLRTSSTT